MLFEALSICETMVKSGCGSYIERKDETEYVPEQAPAPADPGAGSNAGWDEDYNKSTNTSATEPSNATWMGNFSSVWWMVNALTTLLLILDGATAC